LCSPNPGLRARAHLLAAVGAVCRRVGPLGHELLGVAAQLEFEKSKIWKPVFFSLYRLLKRVDKPGAFKLCGVNCIERLQPHLGASQRHLLLVLLLLLLHEVQLVHLHGVGGTSCEFEKENC
jgi:hypothetical protein